MNQFFNIGFKPLFLCTGFSALILSIVWASYLSNLLPAFSPPVIPMYWHGHEMLFGFAGSAIGGFLLTAVANWTRRPPISGALLITLVTSWIVGRLVMAFDFGIPTGVRMFLSALYWLILTTLVGREVITVKNYRNLPVVAVLGGFFALSIIFYYDAGIALRGCLALVCVLITLIGGRIIPAFTTNWLRQQKGPSVTTPVAFNNYDKLVALITLPALVCWCLLPQHLVTGTLLVVSAALHAIRLARWQGHQTISEPLVLSLHAAYAWLPIGLLLLGFASFGSIPLSAGIHALGIGLIAAMIVAVASRAAKGHSGQALTSGPLLSACFTLIHIAVLLRIAQSFHPALLVWTTAAWVAAFTLFTIILIQIIFFKAKKAKGYDITNLKIRGQS